METLHTHAVCVFFYTSFVKPAKIICTDSAASLAATATEPTQASVSTSASVSSYTNAAYFVNWQVSLMAL
jgi:hypothetical protein